MTKTKKLIALSLASAVAVACALGIATVSFAAPAKPAAAPDAKEAFNKAIKKYDEAKKAGLKKDACAGLASKFAAIDLVEAKFNEGVVWEECGDVAKAEQIYQAVLQKNANYGPAINNLGQIYFSRGQVDAAVAQFRKGAELKNSEAYSNLAIYQRNLGLAGDANAVAEAITNIHRSLAVDSYNIDAYGTLALVLFDHAKNRSKLEIARLVCAQAIKVDEHYAPVYNVLGLILLRMGRVTPALAEFRRAVQQDANFLEAHMNIGAVTLSFRDYKSAEEAFAKVITLNPQKPVKVSALVGLGVALRGQRKFPEAMNRYKEAQALDPANPDISYNMGVLTQDYTFDAANPASGITQLQTASGFLQRYADSGKNKDKVDDARRRLKNINDLIPMLREQQKMQAQQPAAPAPAPAGGKKKGG
jgi:tetratricopeptide (TPR) repeat protein